jgi:putative DNA primase/helicase
LMTIMNKILGDFYTPLSEDVMLSFDRKGGATPEIVPLLYSRLGVLPESKEEVVLNCERVKRLTGSDTMTCRALYKDEISFETQSKILLMTNNLPKFNGFDKAMTDRIKVMPFGAVFQNNPSYMDKLKLNIDELFTYIVIAGSDFWINKNLGKIPKIMEDATLKYFKDNDSFVLFIEEECEIGEAGYDEKIYKIQALTAYDYYISFCERYKYKKVTGNAFGQLMEKHFYKKRTKNSVFYYGLRLNNILE